MCISFDYHMYGSGVGNLTLHALYGLPVFENTFTLSLVWQSNGNQGDQWHSISRTVGGNGLSAVSDRIIFIYIYVFEYVNKMYRNKKEATVSETIENKK